MLGLSGSTARLLLVLPPTKKIFPSTTTKYEEIDGVIELPLRRRRRNPEESYRAITTTRESYFNSESSGIADTGEETSDSSPTLTSQQGWSVLACSCALQRCRLVVNYGAHG